MTTPTATIFVPYHVLDELHARGPRAAQPAAADVVPGTLYGVTDEGDVVERSNGAAWEAYSPTGGGGGAPAAHHATHEPGGSDALVDAAWTDVPNVFTADQTIDGDLFVTGTVNPLTDAQRDQINALVGEPGGARMVMSQNFAAGLSLRHEEPFARARIACGNYDTQTYQPLAFEVEALEVHTGVSPASRVEHVRVHPLGGLTVGEGADHATDPGVGIIRARGLDGTPLDATQLLSGTVPVARLGAGTFTVVANSDTGMVSSWAPGLHGNTLVEWFGVSNLTLQSLPGGQVGQVLTIRNYTNNVLSVQHNVGAFPETARFDNVITSQATPIGFGGCLIYQHSGTIWRLILHEQGAWITPPYSAANFVASGGLVWTVEAGDIGTYAYHLARRTLLIQASITTASLSGTPDIALYLIVPGGFTIAPRAQGKMLTPYWWNTGGGHNLGRMDSGGSSLVLYQQPIVNWTLNTNTTEINVNVAIEVT